jgi:hypothetical protein
MIVKGSFGPIRMQTGPKEGYMGGDYYIFIEKSLLESVVIVAEDSGLPGIIGPDVEFRVSDIIKKINEQAKEDMYTQTSAPAPLTWIEE